METLLFALALEVVLLQLQILESTTELKLQVHYTKSDKAPSGKIVRDRHAVKDVIRRTLIEIIESGEWRTLQEAVQSLYETASYAVNVRLDHERLRCSRSSVINELKTKCKLWAVELRNADQKTAVVRDRIKNEQQNANARLLYVEKWLFARAESLEMQLNVPRAPAPRWDLEERVHSELVKAYELQIKEREDMLEYWRQRYMDDSANMDERLGKKREELRVAMERRQELQKLYDLHAGEMRSWLTFKSERAARLAREARRAAAAKRLQSWWRGVMVRRALGSFRYLKSIKKSPSKSKKK